MQERIEIFRLLLSFDDIKALYYSIGETLKTDVDLYGFSSNQKALDNTLVLLTTLKIIDEKEGIYFKDNSVDIQDFIACFTERILTLCEGQLTDILAGTQQYDEDMKNTYVMRNMIPLNYSGLFMILNDLGEVEYSNNRIYIIGRQIKNILLVQSNLVKMPLEMLEHKLALEKQYGEEAERYVMRYEYEKLLSQGINIEPVQMSLIDVTAGYDILSHFSNNRHDEKYIEVKSCDENFRFYFSRNEVAKSQKNKNRYVLYLFSRVKNSITEIYDPYSIFFANCHDEWSVEVDGYEIKKKNTAFREKNSERK